MVISVGVRAHPERGGSQRPKGRKKRKESHHGIPNLDPSAAHNTVDDRSNEWYRPDLGDRILKDCDDGAVRL